MARAPLRAWIGQGNMGHNTASAGTVGLIKTVSLRLGGTAATISIGR